MAINLLFGCAQVETSVRSLAKARGFMQDVLGAGLIEQQLVKEIRTFFPPGVYDVDHLNCGEGMFQINEPSEKAIFNNQKIIHQIYIEQGGSTFTNLNFFVDDIKHAHEILASMGAKTHIEGPSNIANCLGNYGPDNTRAGGGERPFMYLGARHLIGLDLEIMEPNFHHFTKQDAQYPCFIQPRPKTDDGNLKLLRVRLVVNNLEEIYANLVKIFTPGCISKPYAYREGTQGRAFRIGFGGIEFEYCQPTTRDGELARLLDRHGPGALTVEFGARDVDKVVAKAKSAGVSVTAEGDLLGVKVSTRTQIESREPLGYDVVLEKRDDRPFVGNG
jgi:hypothetical protein